MSFTLSPTNENYLTTALENRQLVSNNVELCALGVNVTAPVDSTNFAKTRTTGNGVILLEGEAQMPANVAADEVVFILPATRGIIKTGYYVAILRDDNLLTYTPIVVRIVGREIQATTALVGTADTSISLNGLVYLVA